MKALLHIYLALQVENIPFESPALKDIRHLYPELNVFTLDNFSTDDMVTYAVRFLDEAKETDVLAESLHPEAPLHKLLRLINILVKNPKGKFVLLGEHALLQKMGKPLKDNFIYQPDQQSMLHIFR